MAYFDPATRVVTVRIVYDGLGTAGKTTNVKQVHTLFTLARRGEVFVPQEHKGRTLYFDWLELEAGFVGEYRLRCQLLTVPGQFAYVQRRWDLLRTPDAIIEVCDSSPGGIVRSGYAMRFLRAMLAAGNCPDVPIIVQANKQDVPGALRAEELAAALSLDAGTRVVEAVASTGEGVRPTLIFALQAARERALRQIEAAGVEGLERQVDSAEAVYEKMRLVDDDPDAALEGALLADTLLDG
jgi:signal recognition particle receptor subunit beta